MEAVAKSPVKQVRRSFPVLEMTCAACAVSVESMLKNTEGVSAASVNYANQTALVEYDPKKATPAELQKVVQSIGYDLVIEEENAGDIQEEAQAKQYHALKRRTLWSAVLAVPVFAMGMFFMHLPYGEWISMVLAAPVVFYFGRSFFINTWKQARHGKANMDTLVALSTGIAFIFSAFNTFYPAFWTSRGLEAHVYFEAAVVIIAFISLGKLLEERAKSSTSAAIRKLMGLQPKTVVAIREGKEAVVKISEVVVGDLILVKPGDKVPVDGQVREGSSFVDESMISGEPVPVEKTPGTPVFAGTINQKGSFRFSAEKVGADTLLAHIIKMVKEAQGSKAPVQKLVDKIAGIFVPVVIGISIVTFFVWLIAGGENAFTYGLLNAITVLVIACPCALGLATPTAIMVGVGKGAENNILIKDAESLELGHRVSAIVLDKTGTITEGKPVVSDMVWNTGPDNATLKQILLAMESQSEHPLAEAVASRIKEEKISAAQLQHFESLTGRGVKAVHSGEAYYAGNLKLIEENGVAISPTQANTAQGWQDEAKTVIYFANQTQVLAQLAVADKIKPTSQSAVAKLKSAGIKVHMLTGDNRQTAAAVAKQTGVDHFKAETLPADKAVFVKELQQKGEIVAMVGDGINDSQALAQADVSIAMGRGSDIAMDVAKMTLITSDLQLVPKALRLSRKTVMGVRQNLFWAFIYNLIGIPIAAGLLYPVNGFLLNPMIAGAAMALSSVSVVANSLRLKTVKL